MPKESLGRVGLVQQEILNLNRVRAFTPNVHDQWMREENDRDFIRWCRTASEGNIKLGDIPSRRLTGVALINFFKSFSL